MCYFWAKLCSPKFENEKFSADMEFYKIDPWSVATTNELECNKSSINCF
jgi:hypothetical protein